MSEPKKPSPAPHAPSEQTRKTVEAMASYGIPQEEIAAVIGVSDRTLRKHYAHELSLAATKANAMVAQSLFAKATAKTVCGPSVTAAIFWLKVRARWRAADRDADGDGFCVDRVQPLGKKEIAAQEALRAGLGSEWGDDLQPPGMRPN